MKVLGITSGVGSMLIGAQQLGMEVLGNIEWRPYYHTGTFERNFKGAPQYRYVSDVPQWQMEKWHGVDIIFGHPECGNFSNLRVRKTAMLGDPADLPLFVDLIKEFRPKFFAMDNLYKSLMGYPIEKWKEELGGIYNLFPEMISNFHYGNTQINRRRFFMLGALKEFDDYKFIPGEVDHDRKLGDVISDLPPYDDIPELNHVHWNDSDCMRGWGPHNFDLTVGKTCVRLGDFKEVIRNYPARKNFSYRNRFGELKLRPGYSKIDLENYSPVLSGGGSAPDNHYRSDTLNPLTMRERLRVQGAPDDFIVLPFDFMRDHKTYMAVYKQTGKFMPVEFCKYFAQQVKDYLEGKDITASFNRICRQEDLVNAAKKTVCRDPQDCMTCWLTEECENG